MEQAKINTGRVLIAVSVALLWLLPSLAGADPIKVDCAEGEAIQEKIGDAKPGDTILVSGTCNENVVIPEEVHRITLDGQGTATINGGPATDPGPDVVVVRGTGITIKGFTITGGRVGINVNRGRTATLDGNVIQNVGRNGVNVNDSSFARIINNTIQNNPNGGILVNGGSSVDIGFTGTPSARVAQPNIIQNNGNDGIGVSRSSTARIGFNTINNNTGRGINVANNSHAGVGDLSETGPSGNTISGNGSDGIRVSRSSQASIAGNTINNNTVRGISVTDNSSASIFADIGPTPNTIQGNGNDGVLVGSSSSAFISDNSISNNTNVGVRVNRASQAAIRGNTINNNSGDGIRVEENSGVNLDAANTTTVNNGGRGLRCQFGAYARGSLGTLNGNAGQTSFDATCINALSP